MKRVKAYLKDYFVKYLIDKNTINYKYKQFSILNGKEYIIFNGTYINNKWIDNLQLHILFEINKIFI